MRIPLMSQLLGGVGSPGRNFGKAILLGWFEPLEVHPKSSLRDIQLIWYSPREPIYSTEFCFEYPTIFNVWFINLQEDNCRPYLSSCKCFSIRFILQNEGPWKLSSPYTSGNLPWFVWSFQVRIRESTMVFPFYSGVFIAYILEKDYEMHFWKKWPGCWELNTYPFPVFGTVSVDDFPASTCGWDIVSSFPGG